MPSLAVRSFAPRVALVLLLALVLTLRLPLPQTPAVHTAPISAGPLREAADSHPVINQSGCVFLPDLSQPQPFACGDSNGGVQFAYVGQPVGLNLTVSDPAGFPMNVTVWWDAHLGTTGGTLRPELTNASAITSLEVIPTGPNQPVRLALNWTYWSVGAPIGFYNGYHIYVNVTDAAGYDPFQLPPIVLPWGNFFFDLIVALGNTPPTVEGLQGTYTYQVLPPYSTVPDFVANVTVQDADDDPVVVTWDWGDGNVTVNRTSPAGDGVYLSVTHHYELNLSITPWIYDFILNLGVDDGVAGHNNTNATYIQYYVGLDAPPSVTVVEPTGVERLVVGRSVTFVGLVSDFEGDPMLYYWDFGDGVNTSTLGPVTDGSVSVNHVYAHDGNYSALLWATDGLEKRLCLGTNCSRTHWMNSTKTVHINPNLAPEVSRLTISSNPYRYGVPAAFSIGTFDFDRDPLVVTWDFGDNGTLVFNRTADNVTANALSQSHTYAQWGDPASNYSYNVTAWVDDGQGHNISRSTTIFIGSNNRPPALDPGLILTNRTLYVNDTFALRVNVTDTEGDSVRISVDFGDGTPALLPDPMFNGTLYLNHSYAEARAFTINLTATDGKIFVFLDNRTGMPNATAFPRPLRLSIVVDVLPQPTVERPEPWTWWDYVTLSAVLGIPAAYFVRAGYIRRQERKED